jgi:hypothetical protein
MSSTSVLRLLLALPLIVVLLSPGFGIAQTSTLTVVDNEPVDVAPGEPGPGDNMVFSVRRNATYVVSLAFTTGQPGEIVTHRLSPSGDLSLVGRTPGGPEPRAIAMARDGDYAVVVNSIANEVVVMSVGDDGLLREVSRSPSGGLNPFDVAVGFDDIVVVANRDSDQINTFHLDRRGNLRPLAQAAAGIDPHVVAVSSRGFVAVANQTERSVSLFELNRRGELIPLGEPIAMSITGTDERMVPRTLTWHRHNLFVALDAPGVNEDLIRAFHVARDGTVEQGGDTPCGVFLTDLEANEDGLFAVTVNRNIMPDGTDLPDTDEVRVYRIVDGDLVLDASVQTETPRPPGPSFKQIATGPARWPNDRHVIVSEFQSGWLRSLLYDLQRR